MKHALVLLALLACSKRVAPPTDGDASTVTADASVVDASVASTQVDLLRSTPATVGVSSTVDNPRDRPSHLVDGAAGTAWNSKTGDLVGAWIGFRVPEDARVDRLELTAGYDRVTPAVDLFTANYRITKIRVGRMEGFETCGSPSVRERATQVVALDPEHRGLQRVPVDPPAGGSFCVWVEGAQPGTKPSWRELVVSELRVVGVPGKELRDASVPVPVGVGYVPPILDAPDLSGDGTERGADDADLDGLDAPQPTLEALCGELVEVRRAAWAETARTATAEGPASALPTSVKCTPAPIGVPFTPGGPFLEAGRIRLVETLYHRTDYLTVRTVIGWQLTPLRLQEEHLVDDDERYDIWLAEDVEAISVQNERIVATLDTSHESVHRERRPAPVILRGAGWCSLGAVEGCATPVTAKDDSWCKPHRKVSCLRWDPYFSPPLGIKTLPGEEELAAVRARAPWIKEVPFAIGADGHLHRTR